MKCFKLVENVSFTQISHFLLTMDFNITAKSKLNVHCTLTCLLLSYFKPKPCHQSQSYKT